MADSNTDKLEPKNAERKINEIAKLGSISYTAHFFDRMRERDYDFQDLDLVLSTGKVRKPPEWNSDHNNWKYKMEGNVVEGEKATVVVTILSHNELLCITVMDK
jgi:hypothetical protein